MFAMLADPEQTTLSFFVIVAFSLAIRACVGLFGYSGEATPPMYGDFEAQRHCTCLPLNLVPRLCACL